MVVVGIDLGTTYSCVAVVQQGKVVVIENEIGAKTTPSVVAFDANGAATVGQAAKSRTDLDPAVVIFDAKRLIGRKYDDPEVQQDIKYWPFKVVSEGNIPNFSVNGKSYDPETISAYVLKSLKQQAEIKLGEKITEAVITVPAYFNDGQRQATKDAGEIAGLKVRAIINEPTAAAIAYNIKRPPETLKRILVFDLGGGTFDISILEMLQHDITVLAVGGDNHLGGEDFDQKMLAHCLTELKAQHGIDLEQLKKSSDLKESFRANKDIRRIKNECEAQKINLTATHSVPLIFDAIFGKTTLTVKVTRDMFNQLIKEDVERAIHCLGKVVVDANLTKGEIDEIVLVGGSSKIPFVQQEVQKFFEGKKLSRVIRPDEAVAHGAALYANYLEDLKFKIKDVYPFPLGTGVRMNKERNSDYSVILEKNTSVPAENTKCYFTVCDNQEYVNIGIYEGEHLMKVNNYKLGQFLLKMPPNCPINEPVDVTMKLTEEGILHVSAVVRRDKSSSQLVVIETKGRLSKEKIQNLKLLVAETLS